MGYATLSEAENNFLRHVQMWGSCSWPVRKVSPAKWVWFDFWGVKGAPTVYKTKRDAMHAVDTYIGILCDKAAGRL